MNLKRLLVLGGFAIVTTFILEAISKALSPIVPQGTGRWGLRLVQGAAVLGALFATGYAFRALKLKPPVSV